MAVILAAGKGTRMRSGLPKVLHRAAGLPLLDWVVRAARGAGCERTVVIVGHEGDQVRSAFTEEDLSWAVQTELLGTGHALGRVEPLIEDDALLVVLSGDVPLVSPETLEALASAVEPEGSAEPAWGAMAVAHLEDPGALGRVTAREDGCLDRIVEAADATPEELAVHRVNAGIYVLPAPQIFPYLEALKSDNAKGEYYLTDALTAAAAEGRRVALVDLEDPREAFGVNQRRDLARAHRALVDRTLEGLMAAGVTVLEPQRTSVEAEVFVGPDTVLHPGVTLLGDTVVGEGCEIAQGAWIRSSRIGAGTVIEPYSVLDGADVGEDCRVGPYGRLRPGAVLRERAKVGNFVEVKNSVLEKGVKANHLAYLGDARIGEGSNIGAGVITCNYDGYDKHQTRVGRGVFVGSDTMLVAPVEVGDGAMTAAGSVISKDVPAGSLAVERTSQRTLDDWARRRRTRHERREKDKADAADKADRPDKADK